MSTIRPGMASWCISYRGSRRNDAGRSSHVENCSRWFGKIIPTHEIIYFSEGWLNHQAVGILGTLSKQLTAWQRLGERCMGDSLIHLSCPHGGFHKWGYPWIIHFRLGFSLINDPFGTPIYGNPHIMGQVRVLDHMEDHWWHIVDKWRISGHFTSFYYVEDRPKMALQQVLSKHGVRRLWHGQVFRLDRHARCLPVFAGLHGSDFFGPTNHDDMICRITWHHILTFQFIWERHQHWLKSRSMALNFPKWPHPISFHQRFWYRSLVFPKFITISPVSFFGSGSLRVSGGSLLEVQLPFAALAIHGVSQLRWGQLLGLHHWGMNFGMKNDT